MSLAQHVYRRGGIYHFRVRIPADLISRVGRREVYRSLATACPGQAKRRAVRMLGRILTIFEGLRVDKDQAKCLAELLALSAAEKDKAIAGRVETIGRLEADGAESEAVIDQMADEIAEAEAYAQALARSEEVRSANVDSLVAEMADLLKAEKVGKAAEVLETFRGMMADAGVAMRGMETPRVSEFLATTYAEEKQLPEDSRRHVANYVSLFARAGTYNAWLRAERAARTVVRLSASLVGRVMQVHRAHQRHGVAVR